VRILRAPKSLVAAALLYLIVASAYLYVVPPLEGFDSIAHQNYINYLRKEHRLPSIDTPTAAFSYELVQQPPLYYLMAALTSGWLPYDHADEYVRASNNTYFDHLMSKRWSVSLPNMPASVSAAIWAARGVSMLGGLLAVIAAYLWVRLMVPGEPWLAAAVACLLGLNPVFLFVSTTVSNDSWAVAAAAAAMALAASVFRRADTSLWRWFALGCVIGLAALIKYSTLVVALPIIALALWEWRRIGLARLLRGCAVCIAGVLLTAGFWYIRNLVAYHELVPLEQVARVISTFKRSAPLSGAEMAAQLPFLFRSYWGVFVQVFAPSRFFTFWQWFVIVGCLGLPVHLIRARRTRPTEVVLVSLVWFVAVLVSLLNWMRTVSFGDQARLLAIAGPASGLLLLLGWNAFFPVRWRGIVNGVLMVIVALVSVWPLPILAESFAEPQPLPPNFAPRNPFNVTAANGLHILGFDLPQGTVLIKGKPLPLTLYLTADRLITDDYSLFVHLVGPDNTLLYQFDGAPFSNRHPTRQWQPGAWLADPYSLTVSMTATATLANLEVGFYKFDHPEQWMGWSDEAGQPVDDRLVLGRVRILDTAPVLQPPVAQPLAMWGEQMRLTAAHVTTDAAAHVYKVQLTWQAAAVMHADYTVFVQMLDADGRMVSQQDQEPGDGRAPTSLWLQGELVDDTHHVPIPSGAWHTMIVGVYDHQSGKRLTLTGSAEGQDHLVLQTH
jgi:hypothetical protein